MTKYKNTNVEETNPEPRKITVCVRDKHPIVRAGIERAVAATEDIVLVDDNGERKNPDNDCSALGLPPDVIILDVSSSENDSEFDRRERSQSKLIGFSAVSEARLIKAVLSQGVDGFVHRSEDPKCLVDAIRAAAADRQFISPVAERILTEDVPAEINPIGTNPARHLGAIGAIELLTPRELEVLKLVTDGHSTSEVAETLELSVKTIETHRKNIGDKIGTKNLASLTKLAILAGLTSL